MTNNQNVGSWILAKLNWQKCEVIPTLSATLYFFLIISSYYVLKPLRDSLSLELGAKRIPALEVFSLFFLVFANGFYSWIVAKFSRSFFMPAITYFFIACLVGFRVIFSYVIEPTPGPTDLLSSRTICISAYFVWVNLYILFVVSMFWSFINDHFSSEQSKRLYSTIGLGGLFGGLTGGMITSWFVTILGSANMFLIAATFLAPTLVCLWLIEKFPPGDKNDSKPSVGFLEPNPVEKDKSEFSKTLIGLKAVLGSPLLILLALEVFLYTFGSNIFSFQLKTLMETTIVNRDERTLYWAYLYNSINTVSIISQFIITKTVMKFSRPWLSLLMVPTWQIIGSIFLFFKPSLEAAAIIGVVRYALNYSLGRVIREYFYTPLSKEEKYQGKGFIDTLVFRAGAGISSSLLLSWMVFFPVGGWVDLFCITAWFCGFYVVAKIGKVFPKFLKEKSG